MKKNISINISTLIFHIEEDGYDKLRNYLDTITRYFSTYESGKAIINDIEQRIAELFTSKLGRSKQVITSEDVAELMKQLGSVSDFEALKEEEKRISKFTKKTRKNAVHPSSKTKRPLVRDAKRKLLSGVASGIAHFLRVDPVWVRIIILALAFSLFFLPALGIVVTLTYFVLWLALPKVESLKEIEGLKIIFREPDQKILGGVCGGVAFYTGLDITLLRLLFVIGILMGGLSLIIYLLLWLLAPEAKTITEKIRMQGEVVTLYNIEKSIIKKLNSKTIKENPFIKSVIYPFRLTSFTFSTLGNTLGSTILFIGNLIRVFFGLLLISLPALLLIVLIIIMGVVFGVVDGNVFFNSSNFPIEAIISTFPQLTALSIFLVVSIPLSSVALFGVAITAKKKMFSPKIAWYLAGLFILSFMISAFTLPNYIAGYKKEAEFEEETFYSFNIPRVVFRTKDNFEAEYGKINLYLRGYDGKDIRLVKRFKARGRTKDEASRNAEMIQYSMEKKDSSLVFDANFLFKENAVFRGQDLNLLLYIPYGKEFTIGEGMEEILQLNQFHGDHYYTRLEGNSWISEPSGMKCLTCYEEYHDRFDFHSDEGFKENNTGLNASLSRKADEDEWSTNFSGITKSFPIKNFSHLSINGMFLINVVRGDTHSVKMTGEEDIINNLSLHSENNYLHIEMSSKQRFWRNPTKRVRIDITLPKLEEVDFSGFNKVKIKGFRCDNLDVDLSGATKAELDVVARYLDLDIIGGASVVLKGKADHANVEIAGISNLEAYNFKIKKGEFEIAGASSSEIFITEYLKINATGPSSVKYKGNPKLIEHTSLLSKVNKEN